MKSNLQQTNFFFSAYPLHTLSSTTEEIRPYLRIYRNEDKGAQLSITSKILPEADIYNDPTLTIITNEKNIETEHVEERENDWFASYE